MVLGEAAAAGALGAHALFDYNRENFMYDREMRQEQEFHIAEFRIKQVEMWREDVRDLIGLTASKMDKYLVVGTIQLGMCVTLLTEGRLEPGTPGWLLRLYTLTLGAAFLYLLLSVWLAMHAAVVAQSSGVRLLTQLVRLPVPTWEEIEAMRTYGASFEGVAARQMLRVPFADAAISLAKDDPRAGAGSIADDRANPVDPWGLERQGRDIHELQQKPVAALRHIKLVRRAAAQFRCYDAFARVSMSFGTNQLLYAVSYYCIGYCLVQDGTPWPAFAGATMMVALAASLIHLDLALTRQEQRITMALIVTGPAFASFAGCAWGLYTATSAFVAMLALPGAFAGHAFWLLWLLRCCGVQQQPTGDMLPTKYRTVLYLDVFGWLFGRSAEKNPTRNEDVAHGYYHPASAQSKEQLQNDIALWESEQVQHMVGEEDRARIDAFANRFRAVVGEGSAASTGTPPNPPLVTNPPEPPPPPSRWLKLRGFADTGVETPYLYNTESSQIKRLEGCNGSSSSTSPVAPLQPLSLSFTEERVTSFCERGNERPCATKAKPLSPAAAPGLLCCDAPPAAAVPMRLHAKGPSSGYRRQASADAVRDEDATLRASDVSAHRAALRSSMSCRQAFQSRKFPPLRPEDVESIHLDAEWARHFSNFDGKLHDMRRLGYDPEENRTLKGVGPASAVPDVPPDAFEPGSFYPPDSVHAEETGGDDEFVTGHGTVRPGQTPWMMFKSATYVLVACWTISGAVSLPGAEDFLGLHTVPLPQMMAKLLGQAHRNSARKREREQGGIATSNMQDGGQGMSNGMARNIDALLGGEPISVQWPRHYSFMPRVLGCDSSGTRLVVADDFGIYSGQLSRESPPEGAARPAVDFQSFLPSRSNGPSQSVVQTPTLEPQHRQALTAQFRREAPCTVLEGQALKDIGLVCSGDSACHVLVLHAHGRRLAECPLGSGVTALRGVAGLQKESYQGDVAGGRSLDSPVAISNAVGVTTDLQQAAPLQQRGVRPSTMWEISGGWLNATKERVESVAVDSACGNKKPFMLDSPGCIVVGTTSGRIVQLRRHVSELNQLVPEWAMGQRTRKVDQGSLHVLTGGFVMALRPGLGSIQALDAWDGDQVGEWQLPSGVEWIAIAGGGDNLYVLGRQGKRQAAALWRFPLPAELKQRHAGAEGPHLERGQEM